MPVFHSGETGSIPVGGIKGAVESAPFFWLFWKNHQGKSVFRIMKRPTKYLQKTSLEDVLDAWFEENVKSELQEDMEIEVLGRRVARAQQERERKSVAQERIGREWGLVKGLLTPKELYDIVVRECHASEGMRDCIEYGIKEFQANDRLNYTEQRFCGALGFGGKLRFNRFDGYYVDSHPDDQTPESWRMECAANKAILRLTIERLDHILAAREVVQSATQLAANSALIDEPECTRVPAIWRSAREDGTNES